MGTPQVMADICHEAESFVEYEELFQKLIKTAQTPMSIFESLASSSVRAQQKTHAKLIIVLSRTGKTVHSLCVPPLAATASLARSPAPAQPANLQRGHG
jgi:pyruvate kinase